MADNNKNKKWNILVGADNVFFEENSHYSNLILQILWNRDLRTKDEIKYFLEANYDKDSYDPSLFADMDKSVDLIIEHIKKKNKICIYGDYDADGVSSSSLLLDVLRTLNVEVDFYIPARIKEGYGLNIEALKKIIEGGSKLIITVDTGIRNKKEVQFLKNKSLDIVITDHHQGPVDKDEYPDCLIVNPALDKESYPTKNLAGVGVALKLMQALLAKSSLPKELKSRLQDSFFDLSALGTVADCVSLKGENRLIVKKGLEVMSKTKRLGLIELIKIAKIKNKESLDAWNIGFQIAPRINAAGRMNHANTAFELLITKDKGEAVKLAEELNFNNQMRQKSTATIFEEVEVELLKNKNKSLLSAVYKYEEGEEDKPWNEGIIGLVAGRVTEKHYRPSLIITETKDGYKGSGRSIKEFDITEALEKSSKYLLKYGGHPMACGFSLKKEHLDRFVKSMEDLADIAFKNKDLKPQINIDKLLDFSEIDIKLADSLDILKPFGQDNPQPVFLSKNIQVLDKINMGMTGQHIKLRLKNGSSTIISAIGFGQAERWSFIEVGDIINIVYHIDVNEFNGRRDAQLKIIDIKKDDTK